MRASDSQRVSEFERRFDLYFRRVYAYVLKRTRDHATAQQVTRDVLLGSLSDLLEGDEPELAATLLRATRRSLRSEEPASAARPATSVTRASTSPGSFQLRGASGSRHT